MKCVVAAVQTELCRLAALTPPVRRQPISLVFAGHNAFYCISTVFAGHNADPGRAA